MRFLILLLLVPAVSYSSEYNNVTISRLMIDKAYGNKVFVELSTSQVPTAECHQSNGWHYALGLSDGVDEKIYAMLLTLQASGKPARFVGTGHCDLHDKIETLNRVEMK
jgi:hypothetical protein